MLKVMQYVIKCAFTLIPERSKRDKIRHVSPH
jgi:hypothetical protein